jgi:type IV pilus assembly protein PilC
MSVPARSVAVFTRQLSVMIDAGLPLVQCLEILGRQEPHRGLAASIRRVRRDVEAGSSFADALKRHPAIFDALYANLVAAGETGGILDTILKRLAVHIEKNVRLKRQVKSALIYPVAVLLVAVLVVAAILWKVIPTFAALFQGLGAPLPGPTLAVIALSHVVAAYGWMMVALGVFAAAWMKRYYATPGGRTALDRRLLRAPLVGSIVLKVSVARFCRTLSTLLASGVPILQALDITSRTSGNAIVSQAIRNTRVGIERGDSIAAPLAATGIFPPLVAQMISVGESSGALDAMLSKIADFYEEEVDAAVGGLLALLEPGLVVFLGVVVGGLVIAMYLPIFDLINRVG